MLGKLVILSLIIGLLRGGKLSRLADFSFKGVWLIFLGFALDVLVAVLGVRGVPWISTAAGPLMILSYILIIWALLLNRRRWDVAMILAGTVLNFAVIAANGGRMPADVSLMKAIGMDRELAMFEAGRTVAYVAVSESTPLAFLADVLPFSIPYFRPRLFSVGDVLISLGAFFLIQREMGAGRSISRSKPSAGDAPAA